MRVKNALMKKLMFLHVGWHDREENKIGKLTSLLSSDVQKLQNLNAVVTGQLIISVGGLVASIGVSIWASWKLTLLTFGLLPIFLALVYTLFSFMKKTMEEGDKAYKRSIDFISNACLNIKTILSLGHETEMMKLYCKTLEKPLKLAKKKSVAGGLTGGVIYLTIFTIYGIILLVGADLLDKKEISLERLMISMFSLVFSIFGFAGLAFIWPETAKAFVAMEKIFEVIDTESDIDPRTTSGQTIDPDSGPGKIEFHNVNFSYPTRPDVTVLKDFSLTIESGQKIGLVGASGCGKSTLFQLLLRFYDIQSGRIEIDGVDLKDYNVA